MLSFRTYLKEVKLSRLTRAVEKGDPIGTVSPEREGMKGTVRKAAHKAIQARLGRESKKGMVSWTGPHKGRYKYDARQEPAKEGSYVLRPGNHPKAKANFHRILTSIGRDFKQESVLKASKRGGGLYYGDGRKPKKLGKIHYNRPLDKEGSGDTQLKNTKSSFTVG